MEKDTRPSTVHRVIQVLQSRHLAWALALLAMLTSLPALWTGLTNDDFCQRTESLAPDQVHHDLARVGLDTQNPGHLPTLLTELFIAVGPGKNREAFRQYGALPWWTGKDYKVSLLRPVAALTHWIDYQLYPNTLELMHLHSLLWLGLTVFLVTRLFQYLMGHTCCAGLAALMYALSQNSYFPAMWLANRNQLQALVFGLLTLWMHHRWRSQGGRRLAVLSGLCLVCALLCAEGGIAIFGYLFAYALVLDQAPWRRRALSLAPAVILIVGWRTAYSLAGYGASGGGFYFDPGSQPLAFVQAALQRAPFLLAGQGLGLPPDLFSFIHDDVRWPYAIGLALLCLVLLAIMGPLLRSKRMAQFWCIGMALSTVPVCAAVPMARNLLFAGVGGFALIGQFICGCRQKEDWVSGSGIWQRLSAGLCWILVVVHLPLAAAGRLAAPALTDRILVQMKASLDLGPLADVPEQTLVILNAPNPASFIYVPYERALQQQTLPQALRVLAPGFGPLTVKRFDDKTLDIQSAQASLLTCPATYRLEIVHLYRYLSDFRAPGERFSIGEQIHLPGLSIGIEATDTQGNPSHIRCRFAARLEDTSLRWLQWDWKEESYRAFALPAIGQSVQLRGPFKLH